MNHNKSESAFSKDFLHAFVGLCTKFGIETCQTRCIYLKPGQTEKLLYGEEKFMKVLDDILKNSANLKYNL